MPYLEGGEDIVSLEKLLFIFAQTMNTISLIWNAYKDGASYLVLVAIFISFFLFYMHIKKEQRHKRRNLK